MADWEHEIEQIHRLAIKRSGILPFSIDDRRFLALALAGEVVELANFIKKEWRGDPIDIEPDVRKEMADIRVYLHLLACCFSVDLDEAVEEKLPEIRKKFPK